MATHEAVFDWVLKRIGASGLLRGKTIGIDATTLEANAALRSIVRRDSEQGYEEFLMELAKASGIETPRREDLAKLDRKRTGKGSNRVWKHPHDADARITRMKDGRTHLAHKAEHAVDLETGAIVSVTVQGADRGDTQTMVKTLTEAAEKVEQALPEGRGIEEVVADKGYHSTQRMVDLDAWARVYLNWTEALAEMLAVFAWFKQPFCPGRRLRVYPPGLDSKWLRV